MAKNKKDLDLADSSKLNQISKTTNACFDIVFIILAAICIIPVIFIFMVSISSEQAIRMNGYRFIPESFSIDSYVFLFREAKMILSALGVSVFVTVVGTVLGVTLTTLMGYVLSRRNYNLWRSQCLPGITSWYDRIRFDPGSRYLDGCHPCDSSS